MESNRWDCIVVGGGAAGLSAALVLGRARQRTLVVDAGHPSNAPAEGIGGLLGHDGTPPADFYATGRAELAQYPTVEVRTGEVMAGERGDAGFVLTLADGREEPARRVLLAMGMGYRYPDVPGVAERFGRSVFHCPFCHGWEVRDRTLGVLDNGATGVRRALMLRFWTDDVTLYTNGPVELDAADLGRLGGAGVAVDDRHVAGLRGAGDELDAIEFSDGDASKCQGLLVPVTLHQRSTLARQLGADVAEPGMVAADALVVDGMYHTSVPGLSAAGDLCTQMPSVAAAIADGSRAAAMIVHDLMAEMYALDPV
jgi:thioredoxin reductase